MKDGFLFRRLSPIIPCVLKQSKESSISLSNKHVISSFQDVYINPFYWEALLSINFKPHIIFDLGANFGLFSSLCHQVLDYKNINSQPTYYLVEANEQLALRIKKDCSKLIPHTQVNVLYGLAGPKEKTNFKTDQKNLLASKIGEKGKSVPFIDFNLLPKPDLLKVDIEGAETLLFDHYFDWVKEAKLIIIEFHIFDEHLAKYERLLSNADFELKINRLEASGFHNQLWVKKES